MTISTQTSVITFLGNGSTTTFTFPFVGVAASDLAVIYTDVNGGLTTLNPATYTVVLNAPPAGQIWGVGGTVTYPLVGSPIASGTLLTVQRIVPYEQLVTLSNQGPLYPQSMETGLDLLELQIQQIETAQVYSIQAPESDLVPPSVLPSATARASKYLYFDAGGNPTAITNAPAQSGPIGASSLMVFLSNQSSLSVADALATSLNGVLVIDANAALTAATTLHSRQILFAGGIITCGVYNLTFTSNDIIAGGQIFNSTGSGKIQGTVNGTINVDWWGTTSTSSADATTTNACNDCLTYVAQSGDPQATVIFPKATYWLSASIVKASSVYCPKLIGNYTNLNSNQAGATASLVIIGTSTPTASSISGFVFNSSALGWGLEIRGQGQLEINSCIFVQNAIGAVLHNKLPGDFTEYVQFSNCAWYSTCTQALYYKITSGNLSFHGSGFKDECVITDPAGSALSNIIADNNSEIYNAPMNFQIFTQNTKSIINLGGGSTIFQCYGTPTVEVTSGTPTLTTGSAKCTLAGSVMTWNGNVKLGTCLLFDTIGNNASNGIVGYQKRITFSEILPAGGSSTVFTPTATATNFYCVLQFQNSDNSYLYVIFLQTWTDAAGNNGIVNKTTAQNIDTHALGVPVITWAANKFSLTNANWTNSGVGLVTVTISMLDMDGGLGA